MSDPRHAIADAEAEIEARAKARQNGIDVPFRTIVAAEQVSDELTRIRAELRTIWPAPGSEDTELGVLMGPEGGHGETEVYARVQA